MAIDTAAKRRNVAAIGHYFIGPGVTPNATPDVAWRQQVGWGYGGIAATAVILAFLNDVNSQVEEYLYVSVFALSNTGDFNTQVVRQMKTLTTIPEATARLKSIIVSSGTKN